MKPLEYLGLFTLLGFFLLPALATPAQYLAGIGITLSDTITIQDTINVNLTHAQMWIIPDGGITTIISSANTSTNITGISKSLTQGITFTPNNTLTILKNGTYKIDFSASFSGVTGNQHYGLIVGKGGADIEECHVHRKVGNSNDIGNMGGTCIIKLVVNDTLSLMVENEATSANAIFKDVSLAIIQIN